MSKLVTIYGGSGFVGRQIARRLAGEGWRVRVAVRRTNEALFVRAYGAVGQVEPVPCNIRDDLSVRAAMADADAVINCVGILVREGRNTFDALHDEGAGRIARLAAETGVAHLVHLSAIGADAESGSAYAASKGRGEAAVLAAFPDAVILRPSVIFGMGDGLYNKLAGTALMGPVMPVIGANTKMQPVYVEDVAQAAAISAAGKAAPGIYELGGPDVMTMRQIARQILRVIERRRLVIALPRPIAGVIATLADAGQWITGGLVTNHLLTRDQLRMLGRDNVVADGARGLADFGIEPVPSDAIIPDYLWRFRDGGQYAAIMDSAKQLRQR